MVNLTRGQRMKLSDFLDPAKPFKVILKTAGKATYDSTCFGLDGNGKLSDDHYMLFYNQKTSPQNEIEYEEQNGSSEFAVKLNLLPDKIQKLSFTVSIDGDGVLSEIEKHEIAVVQCGKEVAVAEFTGRDFANEKAIISFDIYRKNEWRINIIAQGYNGGLADLLKSFGGEQDPRDFIDPTPTQDKSSKISLDKKIKDEAPKLLSLVKPLKIVLEKNNLNNTIARVALVLDISGSMSGQYENNTVQEIINKILPLAVQFDDDGNLDLWYYGSYARRMPSVTMKNYESAVPANWNVLMDKLGYGNNEPAVMQEIIDEYQQSKIPAYIVFITDGGINKTKEIENLLRKSSKLPIFWQYVGVAGRSYGILRHLDNLDGRFTDNANFFALDDFKKVSNDELYSRLLNEFPLWLKEAKQKHIL